MSNKKMSELSSLTIINDTVIIGNDSGNSYKIPVSLLKTYINTYSPRIVSGVVSSITLDFSSDTIVHAHTNASTFTITLSNLTAGKTIEFYLYKDQGGTTQVNTGVSTSSLSTNNSSFYLATHTISYFKYICMDGTSSNTFVYGIIS